MDPSLVPRLDPAALGLRLDRNSREPLYGQIVAQLRQAIDTGLVTAGTALPDGARLPSSRDLAAELGVHRKTVVQAFRQLESEGRVEAGVGQGTFIRSRPPEGRPEVSSGAFPWEAYSVQGGRREEDIWDFVLHQPVPQDSVRFTAATADPALFPADDLRTILDEVLRTEGARALDYGPAAGHLPLREWLAGRLTSKGIETSPEQVLIVNGSQQGLDLVARSLLQPGDRVLVEEPSYSNGFRLFQSHGARIEGVTADAGGLRVEALGESLSRHRARLLYVMPIFQNPTGAVLSPDRVGPILDLAASHSVPILEDHFAADLVYEGEPPLPLRAADRRGQVLLLGTFSKILFPGLRLGWLVLPEPLVARFREIKEMADLSTGLLVQYAMDLYCRRGLLDEHLARVKEANARRLAVLLRALEERMPPGVRWTRPRGGMTVWVTLPEGIDSISLLALARRGGVEFSPGPLFFANGGGSQHLRLCYVRESADRIELGVERLASAIREECEGVRARPAPRPFV